MNVTCGASPAAAIVVAPLSALATKRGKLDTSSKPWAHARDAGDVGDALDGFAASRARCFLAEDRERLLGVIESGFGNLDAFDLAVRGMLAQNDQTKEYESSIRRRLDAREHLAVARRGVMSAVRVMRAGRGLVPRESSVAAEVASPPPRQSTRRSTRASWWNRRSRASRAT